MEDFVEVLEGTTIDGQHVHVYKQLRTGLLQIGVEKAAKKGEGA